MQGRLTGVYVHPCGVSGMGCAAFEGHIVVKFTVGVEEIGVLQSLHVFDQLPESRGAVIQDTVVGRDMAIIKVFKMVMDVSDGEDVGELVLRGHVCRKFHGGEESLQLGELDVFHFDTDGFQISCLVFATLLLVQQSVRAVLVADKAKEGFGHRDGFVLVIGKHMVVQGQIRHIGLICEKLRQILRLGLAFVSIQTVGEPKLVACADSGKGVDGGFGRGFGGDGDCCVFGSGGTGRLVVAGAEKEYGGQSDGSEQGLLFHGRVDLLFFLALHITWRSKDCK